MSKLKAVLAAALVIAAATAPLSVAHASKPVGCSMLSCRS